jgi:hypothetical protein
VVVLEVLEVVEVVVRDECSPPWFCSWGSSEPLPLPAETMAMMMMAAPSMHHDWPSGAPGRA